MACQNPSYEVCNLICLRNHFNFYLLELQIYFFLNKTLVLKNAISICVGNLYNFLLLNLKLKNIKIDFGLELLGEDCQNQKKTLLKTKCELKELSVRCCHKIFNLSNVETKYLLSISPKFYEQLFSCCALRSQKRKMTWLPFLRFWDLRA